MPVNDHINIGLAGDVMIGRTVDRAISRYGYLHPWGNMLPLLRSTDLNIINLETTLTTSNQIVEKTFNFKAAPDKIKTLTEAHITAVNLANNHTLDFSEEGLIETIRVLETAKIKYVGAGINEWEAAKPVILSCRNSTIGLLGFTDNEPGWRATKEKSGVNFINIFSYPDQQKALNSIAQLKKEADVVIVSIHWGPNKREKPDPAFVAFAHKMVDQGADLIHGHSAHIFQGIEVYKNKLILYDTGDFVDDYVVDRFLRNDLSFFYIVKIDRNEIYRLQLTPAMISNYQVNYAMGEDSQWCIKRVQKLSSDFGTTVSATGEITLRKEAAI